MRLVKIISLVKHIVLRIYALVSIVLLVFLYLNGIASTWVTYSMKLEGESVTVSSAPSQGVTVPIMCFVNMTKSLVTNKTFTVCDGVVSPVVQRLLPDLIADTPVDEAIVREVELVYSIIGAVFGAFIIVSIIVFLVYALVISPRLAKIGIYTLLIPTIIAVSLTLTDAVLVFFDSLMLAPRPMRVVQSTEGLVITSTITAGPAIALGAFSVISVFMRHVTNLKYKLAKRFYKEFGFEVPWTDKDTLRTALFAGLGAVNITALYFTATSLSVYSSAIDFAISLLIIYASGLLTTLLAYKGVKYFESCVITLCIAAVSYAAFTIIQMLGVQPFTILESFKIFELVAIAAPPQLTTMVKALGGFSTAVYYPLSRDKIVILERPKTTVLSKLAFIFGYFFMISMILVVPVLQKSIQVLATML